MIVVRLMGGLGNQMFQYALGRYISLEKKTPLKLDLTWFENQADRHYQLSQYRINATIASREEISGITNSLTNKIFRKINIKSHSPFFGKFIPVWEEEDSGKFSERVFLCPKTCLMIGYWQSERYFKPVADEIRKEFVLAKEVSQANKELHDKVQLDSNSVSVHIRRGDYLQKTVGHHLCSMDYYERAFDYFSARNIKANYYVFSDDIEWAKSNFISSMNSVFIEPSDVRTDAEELIIMSGCHHHINANSSFSWWGAWLGERKDSIVIVPNQWFVDRPFPEGRVPDRWKRL